MLASAGDSGFPLPSAAQWHCPVLSLTTETPLLRHCLIENHEQLQSQFFALDRPGFCSPYQVPSGMSEASGSASFLAGFRLAVRAELPT